MKKLLVILTALTLMGTLAACGGNNTTQPSGKTDNTRQSEQDNKSSSSTDDSSDTEVMVNSNYLYGKVTKITGNEIELALAIMPEDDTAGGAEGYKDTADIPDGTAVAAVPATAADSGDTFEESMEYTGETLTLAIPTGVKFDSMGQESTMSALKKGSLVSVTVDNLDDMNISSVSILS